jgi:hypothetical protein
VEIKIPKELAIAIGQEELTPYGINIDRYRWERDQSITITRYTPMMAVELRSIIEPHVAAKVKGARIAVKDLGIWISAARDKSEAKPRNVEQFSTLLMGYARGVTGQRFYQHDAVRDVWWAHYLVKVTYHKAYRSGGWSHPAHTDLEFAHIELGRKTTDTVSFYEDDCVGLSIASALTTMGYLPETEELRANYLREVENYGTMIDSLGTQMLARGVATDDVDGNPVSDDDGKWWRQTASLRLDHEGEPARVVIDKFKETDEEEGQRGRRNREDAIDETFWTGAGAEEMEDYTPPEIPTHPWLVVFDLKRHLRLKVSMAQLEPYQYDPTMGERLVLPKDDRALIDILMNHNAKFADVVKGKGQGSIVLSTGGPGLGKTLTAEVLAEVMGKPLYTVQASQLGTTAAELEDELLKSFGRAKRWGAIMLLDECDVYVRQRGDDLEQNAIVGVFLRTLEYFPGILWMTTNRPDTVDDAVASRCIARLDYKAPVPEDAARLWQIQADLQERKITKKTIATLVKELPQLSGRDIKNLVKLAIMVGEANGESEITAERVMFVKCFKPTKDLEV